MEVDVTSRIFQHAWVHHLPLVYFVTFLIQLLSHKKLHRSFPIASDCIEADAQDSDEFIMSRILALASMERFKCWSL